MKIERYDQLAGPLALTNSASTTAKVAYANASGGMVFVDTVSGAATINWYAAYDGNATLVPVYSDGTAVTTPIAASRAVPIPDAVFGARIIAAVLDAGTASARFCLKG